LCDLTTELRVSLLLVVVVVTIVVGVVFRGWQEVVLVHRSRVEGYGAVLRGAGFVLAGIEVRDAGLLIDVAKLVTSLGFVEDALRALGGRVTRLTAAGAEVVASHASSLCRVLGELRKPLLVHRQNTDDAAITTAARGLGVGVLGGCVLATLLLVILRGVLSPYSRIGVLEEDALLVKDTEGAVGPLISLLLHGLGELDPQVLSIHMNVSAESEVLEFSGEFLVLPVLKL
jgi:hypothetical protein